MTSSFPTFLPEMGELFCDYSFLNTVFLRLGRQTINWGISPNYPFTNLMARLPDDPGIDATDERADSVACKVSVPFGVGGMDLVMFTRDILWDALDQPSVDEIGVGLRFNLALAGLDFSIGGFFHQDLNLRTYYSLKSTLFGFLEVYTEGMITCDLQYTPLPVFGQVDFSANAGVYFDVFEQKLKINTEYFYCGEGSELRIKGAFFPLVPGHNLALNTSLSLAGGAFKILLQGKYNIDGATGYIIPAFTLDVIPHVTFSLAAPFVLGPTDGVYFVENTKNANRRACVVLAVIIKGTY
jgi:hypothetical protein